MTSLAVAAHTATSPMVIALDRDFRALFEPTSPIRSSEAPLMTVCQYEVRSLTIETVMRGFNVQVIG